MQLFGREYAQRKHYTSGTHRSRSPSETLAAYAPRMAAFGITRLADVTGLDVIGLPVYLAVRPNSRGLSTSQGKGLDRVSAKASALMESIEGWHGERVEAPQRYESYAELARTARVVDVAEVPLRKGAVLRPDVPMLFVRGHDLLQGGPVWVPHEAVSVNFVLPARASNTFFLSSNGLASGNHLLEAVAHGLCEVIERDAVALWGLNTPDESRGTQVALETVDDAGCLYVLERLRAAGVGVAAWDITSDVGVPTFAAAIFELEAGPGGHRAGSYSGYGCHPSPAVALLRALTEAVQSRLTQISGSRDDILYKDYRHNGNEDDWAELVRNVKASASGRDFASRPSLSTDTFEGDVAALCAALERVGVRSAAVVDLTKEEVGIPVVKVVVPGLEGIHWAASYAPGGRAKAKAARAKVA